MKVWVLAGLFTVATVPFAAAAEVTEDCQLDESRRGISIQRIDSATASGGGGASQNAAAPASATSNAARPAVATRERADEEAERDEAERVEAVQRRRNGNRVPDAELIGPRGAL